MSAEIEIAGIKISQLDWKTTPESVKAVVTVLSERLAYIEEQLKQNSQNSSRPPSSDGFVEPTNNLAEQALRGAVIWRRTSFGSQSQAGSEFVSRILTVVTSLKAQQRDPLNYLTEACLAKRLGLSAPSLLPQT